MLEALLSKLVLDYVSHWFGNEVITTHERKVIFCDVKKNVTWIVNSKSRRKCSIIRYLTDKSIDCIIYVLMEGGRESRRGG